MSDRAGVQLVDLKTKAQREFPCASAGKTVRYSPDGKTLACFSGSGAVNLLDIETGGSRTLGGTVDPSTVGMAIGASNLLFSSDGRALAGVWGQPAIRFWQESSHMFPGHKEPIWLVNDTISNDELVATLERLTNLRYDEKADAVNPLPFKGVPKDWLADVKKYYP